MKICFSQRSWEDYQYWLATDANTFQRLNALIRECARDPFKGTGKPEPLKQKLSGWWSRRINLTDRLVYRVSGATPDQTLEIAQCRFHY